MAWMLAPARCWSPALVPRWVGRDAGVCTQALPSLQLLHLPLTPVGKASLWATSKLAENLAWLSCGAGGYQLLAAGAGGSADRAEGAGRPAGAVTQRGGQEAERQGVQACPAALCRSFNAACEEFLGWRHQQGSEGIGRVCRCVGGMGGIVLQTLPLLPLSCQVAQLEADLAVAEQKVQEGEAIRRKLHNTIQVRSAGLGREPGKGKMDRFADSSAGFEES
jgi:hypothetical protein